MDSKLKLVIFAVLVVVGTFDLICDWLLYYDVSGVEQGLVFGPFPDAIVTSLLVFCLIGTLTYITELVVNILNLIQDDVIPSWILEMVSLVTIWIEDVPQISLSLNMAGCRLQAVSILQMTKSLAAILEVLSNVGVIIARRYYTERKQHQGKLDKRSYWLIVPQVIGLTIVLVFSIIILILTHFYVDSKNVVQFSSIASYDDKHYDKTRYLDGAGVFMNFDSGQTGVVMNNNQWIMLTDLNDITSLQSKTIVVSVKYDSSPNTRVWIQTTTATDLTSPLSSKCYSTSTSPLSVVNTCATDLPLTSATTSVVFVFVYQSPSSQRPLGDIHYNSKVSVYTGGTCVTSAVTFTLKYYKVAENMNYAYPLVTLTSVTGQYYTTGSDILDISDAWKTGHFQCGPTGRSAPKLDTSITVPCLTWT